MTAKRAIIRERLMKRSKADLVEYLIDAKEKLDKMKLALDEYERNLVASDILGTIFRKGNND